LATIPDFIDALAPVLGMHPASMERYLRVLTNAGKIRKSRQGGGKGAVDLNAAEVATALLGLGALAPSRSAAAVDALAPLRRQHYPAATLLDSLTSTIRNRAVQLAIDPTRPAEAPGWELRLRVDPATAWMTWKAGVDGTAESREDFVAPQPVIPTMSATGRGRGVEVIINADVLDAAARLVSPPQIDLLPSIDETKSAALAGAALQDGVPAVGRHAGTHPRDRISPRKPDSSARVCLSATAESALLPALVPPHTLENRHAASAPHGSS
jgi:hypothetical protein